ncbi:hypothetical protein BpHYR1_042307 [Brachionus plicatilis]|uniref:Uncharacterized protein n=1 Tax=Brachionus plicatilis TaxID=10195 RepID=A0A3M7TAK4_BRAPC|nr:hypothetical protein BpHYR1_042307 [Brachionus plicatilis]
MQGSFLNAILANRHNSEKYDLVFSFRNCFLLKKLANESTLVSSQTENNFSSKTAVRSGVQFSKTGMQSSSRNESNTDRKDFNGTRAFSTMCSGQSSASTNWGENILKKF